MSRVPVSSHRDKFLQYALAELERRTNAIRRELDALKSLSGTGMLDPQQKAALSRAVNKHITAAAPILAAMRDAMRARESLVVFARLQMRVVDKIVAAHDLLALYRAACTPRSPEAQAVHDIANAVARDSYGLCHEAAIALGLSKKTARRTNPLVHLEPQFSPAAVRSLSPAAFSSASRYRATDLPIPIVVLPADHIAAISLLTAIHHEIGHIIQQELDFTPHVASAIVAALSRSDLRRRQAWRRWTAEILADVFGIFLGHIGYVDVLAHMLLIAAAAGETFDIDDEHPPAVVRMELLRHLVQRSGLPRHAPLASMLRSLGKESIPDEARPYRAECEAVAIAVLDAPLGKNSTLRQLFPSGRADAKASSLLAKRLLTKAILKRDPARHLPTAARIAGLSTRDDLVRVLQQVQDRALGLFGPVPVTAPARARRRQAP